MKKIKSLALASAAMLTAFAFTSCDNTDNPNEGDTTSVDAGEATIDLVYVAPGEFLMGATPEQEGFDSFSEVPSHQVKLTKGFWIGTTEVTRAQWEAVMGKDPSAPEYAKFDGVEDKTMPVENITWAEAQQFVKKLSELSGKKFRLPTEAEWEYACRGGGKADNLQYAGSKYVDNVACYKFTSNSTPHPVGQFMPNKLNLRDMNGNVSEWVKDNFQVFKDSAYVDPCITTADTLAHVARGGNFTSSKTGCRTASRENYEADFKAPTIGLRVVMDK